MTLNELFERTRHLAETIYEKDGYLTPAFICETKEGAILPIVVVFDDENKDKAAEGIRQAMHAANVVRYACVLESWTIAAEEKDIERYSKPGSVRNDPRRQEIVLIDACDDNGHNISGIYRIVRPVTGRPYLSNFERSDNSLMFGRLANLLGMGTMQ